jgi:alanyl-tRNA synthetase
MTDRLYYHDSFLYEFDATVVDIISGPHASGRSAVLLDQTAFYPTSGGQIFDTGCMSVGGEKLRVTEVADGDGGGILHYVEGSASLERGARIHGSVDVDRRRDHMQQHSGQHVLSAAFVRLFDMPTVSFHMGAESCSIDLDIKTLTPEQVESAEALANDVVTQNRAVGIRFVTQQEAKGLGLRKVPLIEKDELRLIDIKDFDLTACGGTHVAATGQIGSILLRKTEKAKQGWRVEFVCGNRAVATARKDYVTLAEAGGLLSSHVWEVPQQIRKSQEEAKAARRTREELLQELADATAVRMLDATPESGGRKVVVQVFPDRDMNYVKLLGQRITRQGRNAIALLAASSGTPAMVFAASPGQSVDMNALMKEALSRLGGRGGGSKDMAQGGPEKTADIPAVLEELASRLKSGPS